MNNFAQIDFNKEWQPGKLAFYLFEFELEQVGDTFIDMTGWRKGFVEVNGFNIGRFWEVGPQTRLYIPATLLKKDNRIIIFETEGQYQEQNTLSKQPGLGRVENSNKI